MNNIISACFVAMFMFFIQCKKPDLSPVSFEIEGDMMHFKNKNIHLILDELMYCKVTFEVDGKLQSMNQPGRTGSNPLPPHFIMLDDIAYKHFKVSSHEYHKPEAYVIRKKDGTVYYAFFDEQAFAREVELRGLSDDVEYEVIEYDTGTKIGRIVGADPSFHITSKPGNGQGEQVFYYVLKCRPL